ncbi:MAG: CAAX protease [Methylibium sp. NZG]|nr:MAG: CAAX protease [Methylibium sp. NZG]
MRQPFSRAALVRVTPFVLFIALLALSGALPADGVGGIDTRWLYGASVLLVGGLLVAWWREYGELVAQRWPTWREAVLAVIVGLSVFYLWTVLDEPWMRLGEATAAFRPVDIQGNVMWPLVAVRWLGAALLVPVMEELFWRSFLMRWIERAQFETVDPQRVGLKAVVLSTFVFMLAHTLWLAAVVAGLAFVWLYIRTGKLWVPIVAHAVTNGSLGAWVVFTGNWGYW